MVMSSICRRSSLTLLSDRIRGSTAARHNSSKARLSWSSNDYFSNLRSRAAETLTSILSDEERSHLLEKFHKPEPQQHQKEELDEEEVQKTIGEAVVAARTEEAQRQEAKWEREKEELMKEAERAARERVENDLKIQQRRLALERWNKEVEAEKEQEEHQQQQTTEVATEMKEEEDAHPVLGPVLIDLGYKRVHMTSAQTLQSIPVWKKQRIYRHDRAKVMAADKSKTPHLGLPGIIALHEDSEGRLSVLDGQHRVGMMNLMSQKTQEGFDLSNILVEVFPEPQDDEKSESHAQDIFTEINKAEPIKLVDMPGVASKSDRKVISEGASRLKDKFPDMFKPSQQCRAPHLNIDNLRDALFASEVIKKKGLKSPKALMDWMLEQNEALAVKFQQEEEASKVSQTVLKKAIKFNFYLGLDSSWLYN